MDWGGIALIGTGLGLGLRHGIDWDHIAAITDITSTTPAEVEAKREAALARSAAINLPNAGGAATMSLGGSSGASTMTMAPSGHPDDIAWLPSYESRIRFFMATLYALGHALMVIVLGLLAIWASEFLPDWIDPIMERIVGVTLLLLGVWIVYQLWQYGRDYQLRSRWMLVFAYTGRAWAWAKSRVTGHHHHHHVPQQSSYRRRTAFGIGVIHGIGAETGSQALLLAAAAGATTHFSASVLLAAFVVGLLCSNSLVAAMSTWGFASTQSRKNVYFAVGVFAAAFSLIVGFLFVFGQGAALPDLQSMLGVD